jgi:ABC-type branched-subunit amino acid transport system ATPase component/branched-subunit amino acid ABC-type transport system permease component
VTVFIQFVAFGLGAGGLYALAGVGLVLVYRGSGVVNFAQAAVGMVGAYGFYEARVVHDMPAFVALPFGLGVSGAAGALFYLVVMRRMRGSSMLARIVATLALLVLLRAAAILKYGPETRVVPSMVPDGPLRMGSITVAEDRIWIFGIVVVLTAVLWAVYRYTTFGVATTAVAENPRAAAALAVSPDVIATANWAIGSALGGLAVIMLTPITGLHPDLITLIVIPVLAAAVIGRLSSFPITALVGLAIGISESLIVRYHDTPGWTTAAPFVMVTVVLLARGRTVAGKDEQFGRLPALGDGKLRPGLIVVGVAATLACIWWIFPDLWIHSFTVQLALAVVLMSFVVVTGLAGQVSLAQLTFALVGALGASRLMFHHGWSFTWAIPGAALVAIPVAALVGLAGQRTRGLNLAIMTLGFAVAFPAVALQNRDFMRQIFARRLVNIQFAGIDISAPDHVRAYATVTLAWLVLVGIVVANLRRGRAGRRLIAVRTNERAAAALGVSVRGAKMYAFGLGGAIAAIGGVLMAYRTRSVGLGGFGSYDSILSLQYAVFGGVGSVAGPVVGSGFDDEALGPKLFVFLGGDAALLLTVLGNIALLVMLAIAPDGVADGLRRLNRWWLEPVRRRMRVRPVGDPLARLTVVDRGKRKAAALEVEHLTVRFGGTVALDDLSLVVNPGEVVGLIGPNGAGKTTAIEAITGFVTPRQGHVRLGGRLVDRWSRERRVRAGLTRSFQSLELFEDLTVLENILAACDRRDVGAYVTDLVWPGRGQLTTIAREAIADFGLESDTTTKVRDLPYAQRRMLAVARAVAGGQSMLLLDEPAAGLDAAQTQRLSDTIRALAHERGLGVLLIEHNVGMVLQTCDRVYALDFGHLIGEGTPTEIRNNPAVVAAYIGAAAV